MKKLLTVTMTCFLIAAGCSNGDEEQTSHEPAENEDQTQQAENDNEQNQNNESEEETTNEEDEQGSEEDNQEEPESAQEDEEESEKSNPSLTKDKAKEVAIKAERTFDSIVNSTEADSFVMKGYETKEDIVNELESVMSSDLAQSLTDSYFVERNGELYLEPKGGPVWFNKDNPFKLKQISDREYVIVQEHNSEMTGNIVMHYTLTHNGDHWVLDRLKSAQNSQSNTNVTEEQAVDLVRKHIGTQDENVKVEFDHMDGERYVIHVYEVVEQENSSHTATKGWYYVDQNTGEVTNMMN